MKKKEGKKIEGKKKVKLKYEGGKKENKIYKMFWLRMHSAETSRYGTACTHLGAAVAEK